jgi:hypothetical protein
MNDIMRLERAYEITKGIINRNKEKKENMLEHLSLKQIKSDIKFVLDNLKEQQRS